MTTDDRGPSLDVPARRRGARAVLLRVGIWLVVVGAGAAWLLSRPLLPTLMATFTASPAALVFRPDGQVLAVGGDGGTVELWRVADRTDPARVGTATGHRGLVSVDFGPDGRMLAAAGDEERAATLWDVSDPRRPVRRGATGDGGTVNGLAFSPDGRTLATAESEGAVGLWDVSDPDRPARTAVLAGHTGAVHGVAFSPDGRSVVTAGADRTAALWDVTDATRPVRTAVLAGHTDIVYAVAFSPDGRAVATGSRDATAALWDVSDRGRPVRTATLGRMPDAPVTHEVRGVAFSPDGRTLATVGRFLSGSLALWDVSDRARPEPRGVVGRLIGVVAFSPDGRTLAASRGIARTVGLWHVPRQGAAWDVRTRVHPLPALSAAYVVFAVVFGGWGLALVGLALAGRPRRHDTVTRVTSALGGATVVGFVLVALFVLDTNARQPSLLTLVVFLATYLLANVWRRRRLAPA